MRRAARCARRSGLGRRAPPRQLSPGENGVECMVRRPDRGDVVEEPHPIALPVLRAVPPDAPAAWIPPPRVPPIDRGPDHQARSVGNPPATAFPGALYRAGRDVARRYLLASIHRNFILEVEDGFDPGAYAGRHRHDDARRRKGESRCMTNGRPNPVPG
ncbi:MAG: hypothetical protein QOG89_2346 [Thermomicrobiales bacterium]|nr:hypothetical protein [Thermomicrobiales bacterium]